VREQVRHVRSLDEKLVQRVKPGTAPGKVMILIRGQVTYPPFSRRPASPKRTWWRAYLCISSAFTIACCAPRSPYPFQLSRRGAGGSTAG
jgi:hypothetical protein